MLVVFEQDEQRQTCYQSVLQVSQFILKFIYFESKLHVQLSHISVDDAVIQCNSGCVCVCGI